MKGHSGLIYSSQFMPLTNYFCSADCKIEGRFYMANDPSLKTSATAGEGNFCNQNGTITLG